MATITHISMQMGQSFQSPRTGKFESNKEFQIGTLHPRKKFQSPRTGKFESNFVPVRLELDVFSFNPLERGNSNQIEASSYWGNTGGGCVVSIP